MRYCRIRSSDADAPRRRGPIHLTLPHITLGALGLAAALQLVRIGVGPERGLRAEYYASDQGLQGPVMTGVEDNLSSAHVADAWRGAAPSAFRARWYGYLTISRPGSYSFATTSDDASFVSIDGRRVVDNGGAHGPTTASGTIQLAPGSHFVMIEFAQFGGGYEIGWSWAREGRRLAPVPSWPLTVARESRWKVLGARVLDLTAMVFVLSAVVLAVPLAYQQGWTPARHPAAASLLFFVALAALHTWPLASDPGHLTRHDNRDTLLNEWIIAWIAHQAPRAPLHLFDANIFHPERYTLAYSEAMIVQAAMGAPIMWLGGSPVLAYGLLLLAGFALTGWSLSLVVQRWTNSWTAGLVAGLVFGFSAHTLTRLPHLQAQHVEFLPLVLLALDRLLAVPGWRAAAALALWFTLQCLTSVYLLVLTTFATGAAIVARPGAWRGGRWKVLAGTLGLAGALTGLVLVPYLLPYWHANHDQGLTRGLAEATQYSATWEDYLSTPSNWHYPLWSYRFFQGTALFPGGLGLALSLLAIGRGIAIRDDRARMCLAIGALGIVLSFGPKVPGYPVLYTLVPLLRGIRATARFGYLATLAVAVLAGFGVVGLRRMLPARVWPPVAIALVVVAAIEQLAAPVGFRRFDGIPPIYGHLPPDAAAVVEIPFFGPRGAQHHATYMLNSTAHWRPIVNGYSGFQPPSFHRHAEALADFPGPVSLATLRDLGVTHVFVHIDELAPDTLARLAATPDLRPIEAFGTIALYRLGR